MKILTNLDAEFKHFYKFLGIHTFLVGLFPVLLPSFLWKMDIGIALLSLFISITGLGFICSLWLWERVHQNFSFKTIIIGSFLVQIAFMSSVLTEKTWLFLPLLALLNGAYNCFFWITQRALFFETIELHNSGRKFGNFQIFVAGMLNLSIVISAILLEKNGFIGVYILTTSISVIAILLYLINKNPSSISIKLKQHPPLSLSVIKNFKDQFRSRLIFLLDGLFLFLESYFWLVSLFIISHESFLTLSLWIVSLTAIFAVIFYLIKNTIDYLSKNLIYNIGVLLYSLSWVLRMQVNEEHTLINLFLLLIAITFSTSFFRLAFNKRFFDIAKITKEHQYLFLKSYWSQLFIALIFALIAFIATYITNFQTILHGSYFVAALLTLNYFFYKQPVTSK